MKNRKTKMQNDEMDIVSLSLMRLKNDIDIGNVVGALAIRIIGNKNSVAPIPLFKFITAILT